MTLSPSLQHRKLASLANFLDDLPHTKFHMPTWGSSDATEHSCGTAGCAAGWAATIFRREGWRFDNLYLGNGKKMPVVVYGPFNGAGAFSEFFQIPYIFSNHITTNLVIPEYISPENRYQDHDLPPYAQEYNLFTLQERALFFDHLGNPLRVHVPQTTITEIGSRITPSMAASRIRQVLSWVDPSALTEPTPTKTETKAETPVPSH